MAVNLAQIPLLTRTRVARVGGRRNVRRRLMELGLTPGTELQVISVSPLGDPLQLEVRGCRLSIRKKEALALEVET
jgi:ferrous iron transport protein A